MISLIILAKEIIVVLFENDTKHKFCGKMQS